MGGVTILETERLILRPWHTGDAEFVLDLYSRWEVQRFIGNQPRVMVGMGEAVELIGKWRALDHSVHGDLGCRAQDPSRARPTGSLPARVRKAPARRNVAPQVHPGVG